jgi:hypothetical protein
MPVRRHSIDLPTANKETSTDRRRRRPSADIALAEPIVEGVIVPEGIDAIIKLEAEYDRMAADAKTNRWDAAERYAEELAKPGMTQTKLAALVGKTQPHVSKMSAAWAKYSLENNRPSFQDVYRELSSKPEAPAIDSAPKAVGVVAPKAKPGKTPVTPGRRPRVGSYRKAGTEDHLAKHYLEPRWKVPVWPRLVHRSDSSIRVCEDFWHTSCHAR